MVNQYWHELTKAEQDSVLEKGISWQDLLSTYQQPPWCGYPDALENLGCWSLLGGTIHCQQDCGNCELINPL